MITTHRSKEYLRTQLTLTTFSKGAAPNTLKTGLGLEGEIQRTIACCPTRVVYSSNVARSFLNRRMNKRIKTVKEDRNCSDTKTKLTLIIYSD